MPGSLGHNMSCHGCRPRAECEANADLTLALADSIGHHAVDADEAQAEAGGSEDGEQESDEPRAAERTARSSAV